MMFGETTYEINWKISKKYFPTVKEILKQNAALFVSFETSTFEQDTEQACDAVCIVKGGTIAVRSRQPCDYQDFTIRSVSMCNKRTEYDKLKDGFGDWYIYTWDKGKKELDYIIVDIHKFRELYIDNPKQRNIPNKDGTKFHAWKLKDIEESIIVKSVVMPKKAKGFLD